MKLILPAMLTMASMVAADKLITYTTCGAFGCSSDGRWFSDSAQYRIDANEGCHDWPGPWGMRQLCMDWGNKRGHMYFEGQNKRCIRKGGDYDCTGYYNWSETCADWNEVGCDW